MATWTADELDQIGNADELRIAGRHRDGSLRNPVTIWVVRSGDDLFVRSFRGAKGSWYQGTQLHHEGHIEAGGVDRDVAFTDETDPGVNSEVDNMYRDKYSHYGAQYLDPMLAESARATTMRLVPR